MSSRIDQEEKFSGNRESNIIAHHEVCGLKNAESPTCQSSDILFDSPQVVSEHRDKSECQSEINLSAPLMQATCKRHTEDIERLDVSDSAILLDDQCSRSNGEESFEKENAYETEDMLQSRDQVEPGSPQRCENKEKNSSYRLNDDENNSLNAVKSRASNVRSQPEILLQPLSLQSETLRSRSSSGAELRDDSPSSVHSLNPTTSEHSRAELGADPPESSHFTKPAGPRQHSSAIAGHRRVEHGADNPGSVCSTKPTGPSKHSNPSAGHSRAELRADPPGSVRFTKPTDSRLCSRPTAGRGRENRDIFETGGEQSRYPSAGASFAGGEEIEHLPLGDSPEPKIVIPPSLPDEPRMNLFKLAKAFVSGWFGLLKQRACKQFVRAPFFYLICTVIFIIIIFFWEKAITDQDVYLSICGSLGTFVVITFLFERGQFSPVFGRNNSRIRECIRACGNAEPCIPWFCCKTPEPLLERHSQYRHLEVNGAFEHEIADVSNLGPKDCPQMRMVQQRESAHEESPDYHSEVSQVSADVHVGKRNDGKLGATRKHLGRAVAQTTKPHKTRSSRSHARPSKTFRADIHATDLAMNELSPPELSPIRETALEDGMQNGEGQSVKSDKAATHTIGAGTTSKDLEDTSTSEDLGTNESSKMTTRFPGSAFEKFSDRSQTLPRFANAYPVDVTEVPDDKEFKCEHYGQSVACSCATFLSKSLENRRR